jgi:hypothetical protein
MGPISGCRYLKVNLKAKIYISGKIFLLEDFFHLPPVSLTSVVHLEPGIFEKIRNVFGHGILCVPRLYQTM